MTDKEVRCPVCKTVKMHKAGFGWSGKNKVARVCCPRCGKIVQRK